LPRNFQANRQRKGAVLAKWRRWILGFWNRGEKNTSSSTTCTCAEKCHGNVQTKAQAWVGRGPTHHQGVWGAAKTANCLRCPMVYYDWVLVRLVDRNRLERKENMSKSKDCSALSSWPWKWNTEWL
jgi:hypothetical protein